MNTKDLTNPQNTGILNPANQSSLNRARSFKVKTTIKDYSQYVNTIKAYALAGMPFEHIANAGEALGDEVEKGELDATLQESWKGKVGEIAENEGKILAWQSRGEKESISFELPQSTSAVGVELVTVTQELTTTTSEKTIDVIEGIAVLNQEPQQVIKNQQNSQLENNPYLQGPIDLKK